MFFTTCLAVSSCRNQPCLTTPACACRLGGCTGPQRTRAAGHGWGRGVWRLFATCARQRERRERICQRAVSAGAPFHLHIKTRPGHSAHAGQACLTTYLLTTPWTRDTAGLQSHRRSVRQVCGGSQAPILWQPRRDRCLACSPTCAPCPAASRSCRYVRLRVCASLQERIQDLGPYVPLLFVAVVAGAELIPLFPTQPLTLASGLLFGPKLARPCRCLYPATMPGLYGAPCVLPPVRAAHCGSAPRRCDRCCLGASVQAHMFGLCRQPHAVSGPLSAALACRFRWAAQ